MSHKNLVAMILLTVGLINFAPIVGLLGADNLARLYDIAAPEGDLQILLRHRALLFGIVGAFIIWSAFKPMYQPAAMLMAAVSMVGYIVLVYLVGEPGIKLYKVALIDAVACVLLLAAMVLYRLKS